MSLTTKKLGLLLFLFVFGFTSIKAEIVPNTKNENEKYSAYLFVYFTGNTINEEQIRFALSDDGYNFKALNNNQPVISSKTISLSGGVRDPHILRCEDGKTFYMVATDMVSAKG